jgi:hypothetical protein
MWAVAALPVVYQTLLALRVPLPYPAGHDEFSYLLGADTLVHGRFANPTPGLVEHFETMHVLMSPTYASKYPIGQAASLAVGKLLFGHPYWGVVMVLALAGAAAVWATRVWAGPIWALISGIQVIAVFGTHDIWARSYWGGGLAFLGAMLVIGGYRVLTAYRKGGGAWPLAIGLALLFFTRPYEGGVLGLCAVTALTYRAWRDPVLGHIAWRTALPVAAGVLGVALLVQARVNYSVTGNFLTMPYVEHQRQYMNVPAFRFQPLDLTEKRAAAIMDDQRSWMVLTYETYSLRLRLGEIHQVLLDRISLGAGLLATLALVVCDRLSLFLVVTAALTGVSLLPETYFHDHYAAPFLAVTWVLQFYMLRQLTSVVHRPRIAVLTLLAVLVAGHEPAKDAAAFFWTSITKQQSTTTPREAVERTLQAIKGRHLVIVRRGVGYSPHHEWVYNAADIENAQIIWARDLGDAANARLFAHFRDRTFWLCEPENTRAGSTLPALTRLEPPSTD